MFNDFIYRASHVFVRYTDDNNNNNNIISILFRLYLFQKGLFPPFFSSFVTADWPKRRRRWFSRTPKVRVQVFAVPLMKRTARRVTVVLSPCCCRGDDGADDNPATAGNNKYKSRRRILYYPS